MYRKVLKKHWVLLKIYGYKWEVITKHLQGFFKVQEIMYTLEHVNRVKRKKQTNER